MRNVMTFEETSYKSLSSLDIANLDVTYKYFWNIKGMKVFAPILEVTVNADAMNKIAKTFLGEKVYGF